MGANKDSFVKKLFTFEWISIIIAVGLSFVHWSGSLLVTAWWFYFLIHHRDFLLNVLGDIQMGGKKYPNAISYYKQCARTTIANIKYVKKYAIMEIKHGDPLKAEETINKIEKQRKPKWVKQNELDLKYLKALISWKKGDVDTSLNILTSILETVEDEEIYGTLSYMHLIKGDVVQALEFSRSAYEKYPNNIIVKSIFAISAYLNDNVELASELFEELVSHNLNIPDTFYHYAKYMISKDEYKKAELALKKGRILLSRTIITSVSDEEFLELLDMVRDHLEELEDDNDDFSDDFDNKFDDNFDEENESNEFDEIATSSEK